MEEALFSTPSARFQGALALASEEYYAGIDMRAYSVVDNPYTPEIIESHYYKLVEQTLECVKESQSAEQLFYEIMDTAKHVSSKANNKLIDSAQFHLKQELDLDRNEVPDADEQQRVQKLWHEVEYGN